MFSQRQHCYREVERNWEKGKKQMNVTATEIEIVVMDKKPEMVYFNLFTF